MSYETIANQLSCVLDEAHQLVIQGKGVEAISRLCLGLIQINEQCKSSQFQQEVIPACRKHPLFELVQEDPYSRRAFEKPRGYAGDALMLDYVYDGIAPPETTQIGKVVFEGTTRTSNGLSVLDRRMRIAQLVSRVAEYHPSASVGSLAAGHLREADLLCDASISKLGNWLAIDQDPASLEQVKQSYPIPEIITVRGSVADLIFGKLEIGRFDCFYSAGLFDYLNERLSKRAIASMFGHLKPGGELLVSNFTHQSQGRFFMEAFMDWTLIYRSDQEMLRLIDAIPKDQIDKAYTYFDEYQNIVYLHLVRATM